MNIAPKKPNWDLRRDVQKKLDKLERRTQKAMFTLMRKWFHFFFNIYDIIFRAIIHQPPVFSSFFKNTQFFYFLAEIHLKVHFLTPVHLHLHIGITLLHHRSKIIISHAGLQPLIRGEGKIKTMPSTPNPSRIVMSLSFHMLPGGNLINQHDLNTVATCQLNLVINSSSSRLEAANRNQRIASQKITESTTTA